MEKIKAYFNIFGPKQNRINLSEIKPYRDWKIIILFFSLFLILGLLFDYQVYKITEDGNFYVDFNNESLKTERLNVKGINEITKYFGDKKVRMENLKKNVLVDPSI